MSYFSTTLQRQAERRRLSQSDLVANSGLSKSYMSRLFSGEVQPSDEHLVSLLKAFAADPSAQAELIAALCLDLRQVASAAGIPGADLVEIRAKSPAAAKAAASPSTTVPAIPLGEETEKAFDWLRSQCPLNPNLEKHLVVYAHLLGMK